MFEVLIYNVENKRLLVKAFSALILTLTSIK